MSLTKTHIESLVQTFANHKQPPAIYVTVRMSKIEMTKKNRRSLTLFCYFDRSTRNLLINYTIFQFESMNSKKN